MNKSFRADGKEEVSSFWFRVLFLFHFSTQQIVLKVECGSRPGFATSGWQASSTYQVNVIAEDPMSAIIAQLKEKAGKELKRENCL